MKTLNYEGLIRLVDNDDKELTTGTIWAYPEKNYRDAHMPGYTESLKRLYDSIGGAISVTQIKDTLKLDQHDGFDKYSFYAPYLYSPCDRETLDDAMCSHRTELLWIDHHSRVVRELVVAALSVIDRPLLVRCKDMRDGSKSIIGIMQYRDPGRYMTLGLSGESLSYVSSRLISIEDRDPHVVILNILRATIPLLEEHVLSLNEGSDEYMLCTLATHEIINLTKLEDCSTSTAIRTALSMMDIAEVRKISANQILGSIEDV